MTYEEAASTLEKFCEEYDVCKEGCPLWKRRKLWGIEDKVCPIDLVINSLIYRSDEE